MILCDISSREEFAEAAPCTSELELKTFLLCEIEKDWGMDLQEHQIVDFLFFVSFL